jgi:hypothetical protein
MNKLSLTLGIAVFVAALLLLLNATPNVAKAYNCSSSSSTTNGNHESSSISGPSGSCATSTSSSSKTNSIGGGHLIGPPPPNSSGSSSTFPPNPGASISNSLGGAQSSCLSNSASHTNVGQSVGGSTPGSISCSTHNP